MNPNHLPKLVEYEVLPNALAWIHNSFEFWDFTDIKCHVLNPGLVLFTASIPSTTEHGTVSLLLGSNGGTSENGDIFCDSFADDAVNLSYTLTMYDEFGIVKSCHDLYDRVENPSSLFVYYRRFVYEPEDGYINFAYAIPEEFTPVSQVSQPVQVSEPSTKLADLTVEIMSTNKKITISDDYEILEVKNDVHAVRAFEERDRCLSPAFDFIRMINAVITSRHPGTGPHNRHMFSDLSYYMRDLKDDKVVLNPARPRQLGSVMLDRYLAGRELALIVLTDSNSERLIERIVGGTGWKVLDIVYINNTPGDGLIAILTR